MKENIPSGLKEEKTFDTHIQKHIAPMWGSLRLASVKYFIETGTVNGGFREALIAMMSDIILDYEEDVREPPLPNDNEVSEWFSENIDSDCSASSGIYKFRLWLKDRLNQVAQPPSSTSVKVEELAKEYEMDIQKLGDNTLTEMKKNPNHICTQLNKDEVISYNTGFHTGFKAGFLAASTKGKEEGDEVEFLEWCFGQGYVLYADHMPFYDSPILYEKFKQSKTTTG